MTRYLLENSRKGTSDLWGQRGRHDARISLLATDDVGMYSLELLWGSANKKDTESEGRRILYTANGEQRRAAGRRGKDRGRASDEPASLTCRAHLPAPAGYGPCPHQSSTASFGRCCSFSEPSERLVEYSLWSLLLCQSVSSRDTGIITLLENLVSISVLSDVSHSPRARTPLQLALHPSRFGAVHRSGVPCTPSLIYQGRN